MAKLNYDLWAFVLVIACLVTLLALVGASEAKDIFLNVVAKPVESDLIARPR